MDNYIDDSRIHEGHRERMRRKLLKHGQDIFDTYELLEMLLYHVIPYKDTNPIAKRLLCAFGSLDGVLKADKKELMGVSGIGERSAEFIVEVGRLSSIIGAEIVPENDDCFTNYESVGEFLVDFFADAKDKCVGAMFLDSSMRLICAKILYNLDYESGGVKAKTFIDEAVKNRASVVITAHCHPFGPFYPSDGDRATNNAVTNALNIAGLVHAEHYIVSGTDYAGIGSLKNFRMKLSQMPQLNEFLKSKNNAVSTEIKASAITEGDVSSMKVRKRGSYNVYDYEYFVNLLEFAIGSRAESVALELLTKYRTIEGVFNASEAHITVESSDKCAFYLKTLAYIASRRQLESFAFGISHTKAEIADYLKALFLGQSVEKIYLITFGKGGAVIGCDLLGEGTVNSSEILPRKALEVAISRGASSVAISHNHPGGVPSPSSDDINLTAMLGSVFSTCDISLIDHYVIAGQLCEIINISEDR